MYYKGMRHETGKTKDTKASKGWKETDDVKYENSGLVYIDWGTL